MDPQSTSQPNLTVGAHRPSVSSQAQSIPTSDRDPRDNYDYQDYGPSNTPSKKIEGTSRWPASSAGSQLTAHPQDGLNPQQLISQLETNLASIYERETKGTRARPQDTQSIRFQEPTYGIHSPSTGSSASHRSRRSDRQRREERPEPDLHARDAQKTTLRRVMLNWGKEHDMQNDSHRFFLHAHIAQLDAFIQSRNAVVWQHSDIENLRITDFETLVADLKTSGLQDSDIGLAKRLLKRVKLVSERDFVRGSFLTPTAMRYDMLDDSRYGVDRCCIFLDFPYFAVETMQHQEAFQKGDPRHPTRSLLQSRYRLNETGERDDSQCIKMLDNSSLRSCVKPPEAVTSRASRKVTDKLIYVPQLWALIMGPDHMVTAGPISDQALQGSEFSIRNAAIPPAAQGFTFVRISFINHGMPQEITFPLSQCASWFGLLNKHQQIRNALRQGKSKASPMDYPLRFRGHILEGFNWAWVQRSTEEEILKLWMETPKPPSVTVNNHDGDSGTEERHASGTDDESVDEAGPSSSVVSSELQRLHTVPIVRPFLGWRVVDDFGETNNCPMDIQASRFLKAIYRSLPAVSNEVDADAGAHTPRGSRSPRFERSARPKIVVVGKLRKDVDDLGYERTLGKNQPSIEQELWWQFGQLFWYFVPNEHEENSAPVQLFWGALYELMEGHRPSLDRLLELAKEINSWAERLHLGVHFRRRTQVAGGRTTYSDSISDSAILLASMVDALGAVFNMLVEAVHDARTRHHRREERGRSLGSHAVSYGNEACQLLETARNQLITEATGVALGENVGPVVTPEAILILTMERLVRGVFGTGSVDIISLLEECLELLALRVENHFSRRLLQKLNAFEEEVGIVNDVLLQQKRVLLSFCECLNPAAFKKPTTARRMRFEFERQGINRTLILIDDQLQNCAELRERAKTLAIQNVQLVETLADDNGRVIFVFTFITVLFLPLTFVAGFFGMNLSGISNSDSGVSHFWYIGMPLTAGILILCIMFVVWGESIWFAIADLLNNFASLFGGKRKVKRA